MKTALVLLLIACSAVSALSPTEDKKPATLSPVLHFGSSTPAPAPKLNTTTKAPTPNTTTKAPTPTTTTKAPTPTTTTKAPKPTTTTKAPKPTTTTKAPKPTTTTKAPKPTTTTKAPKPPTTTKPPTPAPPKPTPTANLTVGNYTLKTDKGALCLMAQMALQIRLAETKVSGNFTVQPNLTKSSGDCKATTATLSLTFKEGNIKFMFTKNATEKSVYVSTLSFKLAYPLIPGGKSDYDGSNHSLHLFAAKIGDSYFCKSESVYMGNGLYLDVTQDKMQAFNLTNNNFGLPNYCIADQPDYRVAIAVGVTLLVLIIIVVVAYLLGRRRRTDGYQTL